ncbi:MAG: DNA-directed RNA polymerase specialized sigma24 family protein [Verrucomicrobiales bacterium]|jgi:DNA-directed RNA polymerase specialized sigma24 family protein
MNDPLHMDTNHDSDVSDSPMGEDKFNQRQELFPPTRWTLVAQSRDPKSAGRALDQLCELYWFPVYAFIRCKGKSHHDAQDLTQGFFASLLSRDDFAKADPERGKLRAFITHAATRFVISSDRMQHQKKRGGDITPISLDVEEARRKFDSELSTNETPESCFERLWAITVLDTAQKLLKEEYKAKGKAELLAAIIPYVSLNSRGKEKMEIATQLGLSDGAFRMALFRMRQRYGEVLRDTVADTLTDPSEVEDELSYLFEIFGR